MKKAMAILLAMLMLIPFATIAFAANTTTLTTTVPGATYTLNIPSDQEIAYGAFRTTIDAPTVTDSSGFAEGKNLYITATYSAFSSPTTDTTIPFRLENSGAVVGSESTWLSGRRLPFLGQANGTVATNLTFQSDITSKKCIIVIDSTDWGKAAPGNYTATITFTTEVANAKI
ncbi:MAG: hypothetical protein PUA67_03885 [Ruminococcus sp.]|nr:hypothetical protein [Ruminococcus sp.]